MNFYIIQLDRSIDLFSDASQAHVYLWTTMKSDFLVKTEFNIFSLQFPEMMLKNYIRIRGKKCKGLIKHIQSAIVFVHSANTSPTAWGCSKKIFGHDNVFVVFMIVHDSVQLVTLLAFTCKAELYRLLLWWWLMTLWKSWLGEIVCSGLRGERLWLRM